MHIQKDFKFEMMPNGAQIYKIKRFCGYWRFVFATFNWQRADLLLFFEKRADFSKYRGAIQTKCQQCSLKGGKIKFDMKIAHFAILLNGEFFEKINAFNQVSKYHA